MFNRWTNFNLYLTFYQMYSREYWNRIIGRILRLDHTTRWSKLVYNRMSWRLCVKRLVGLVTLPKSKLCIQTINYWNLILSHVSQTESVAKRLKEYRFQTIWTFYKNSLEVWSSLKIVHIYATDYRNTSMKIRLNFYTLKKWCQTTHT